MRQTHDTPRQAKSEEMTKLEEILLAERAQHEREMAEQREEYSALCQKLISVQEQKEVIYEKLLQKDQDIQELSQRSAKQEAMIASLLERLQLEQQSTQKLSERVAAFKTIERRQREKEQLMVTLNGHKDDRIKDLSKRLSDQETIIRKLATSLGLQACILKGKVNSTEL